MINPKSIEKEWIEQVSKSCKADKVLVEKVIRALSLLEGLAESDLDFVFKGGTALMLLLSTTKRLSIDIDIIVPDRKKNLDAVIEQICIDKHFLKYERQERKVVTNIEKEHYKLFFTSALNDTESHIILDVLKEDIHYETVVSTEISSNFISINGDNITVKTPDFNNILGDKLTAFAPNTTGIPYKKGEKEMGMEIIKQMYDIGCICDNADDISMISRVFTSFAETELKYRDSRNSITDVLDDTIETSLSICLRKDLKKTNFEVLNRGVLQVKSFIFSDSFHLEKAVTYAAKAAYIASLIKNAKTVIARFDPKTDMKSWTIQSPMDTKLNKLKKTNIEAFFYLYQISEMEQE